MNEMEEVKTTQQRKRKREEECQERECAVRRRRRSIERMEDVKHGRKLQETRRQWRGGEVGRRYKK